MRRAGVALALAAVLGAAACSSSGDSGPPATTPSSGTAKASPGVPSSTLVPDLDTYTDRGDGCPQVVSAIGYADEVLPARGRESATVFDDSVRSRLAAVGGTIALELDDFPSAGVLDQARVVQPLAERSGALIDEKSADQVKARQRTFVRYRAEAAKLVADCVVAMQARKKLPSSPATAPPTSP